MEANKIHTSLIGKTFEDHKIYMSLAKTKREKEMLGRKHEFKMPSKVLAGVSIREEGEINVKVCIDKVEQNGATLLENNLLQHEDSGGKGMSLDFNHDFMKELKLSLILETINEENVESVSCIVEGLGFSDVVVRGIDNKTFLAYFPTIEDLLEIDVDFLGIGFAEVRRVNWENLIPPT